jgi:diguanylate cyclase (GGDEF)-like protein
MVNDVHGHQAGDAALVCFAEAVSRCIRPYDSVGRYGGEEFLLVLTGIPSRDVEDRLYRLHKSISNLAVSHRQMEFRITCSLGAVLIAEGQNTMDQESALAVADKALYKAKELGRDQVILQQGAMHPDRSGSNTAPQY